MSEASASWPRLSWGLFLLVILGAVIIVFGAPVSASFLVGALVAVLIAWRYPYGSFYFFVATSLLLGLIVSISTGTLQIGERAFGGSIDVSLGEVAAGAVLAAWAFRVLFLRPEERGAEWKPWLPLLGAYLLLVGAHLLSILSPALPDPVLALKYTLRPVFLVYLTSVILPVNFIQSRRRLKATLLVLTFVGLFFAFDGFRSLFVFSADEGGLHRARPLPIIGTLSPLGGNHNALAELMLLTVPVTLAWITLARSSRGQRLASGAAVFMSLIALLTFARSAWIALACELVLLLATVWKPWVKRQSKAFFLLLLAFVPLAAYMVVFSLRSQVQGSTDSRAMVTAISYQFFRGSPWIGVGAGSFLDRLGRVYAYTVEFGAPIESHGVIQKLLAETGIIGLLAFCLIALLVIFTVRDTWRTLNQRSEDARAYLFLVAALLGSFVYQLFDTTYWTPRLWLPVGLVLAAGRIFKTRRLERDPDFLAPL